MFRLVTEKLYLKKFGGTVKMLLDFVFFNRANDIVYTSRFGDLWLAKLDLWFGE